MNASSARFLLLVLVCAVFSFSGALRAQAEDHQPLGRRARPNVELPPQIVAEPAKLTLFVDFEHPDADGVPLYVVNRTGEIRALSHQDGDFYLKLDVQQPDGSWERAQSHLYSDCGNSYSFAQLQPGMHFRLTGLRVSKGENAMVRYSCYGGETMASNSAAGLIDLHECQAATENLLRQ